MNRCLRIPELLDGIVSHLEPDSHGGTLAALAQAARLFHDPALNVLWRSQKSLVNILRCLPRDLLEEQTVNLRFLRPIVESDWERPRSYAERIKDFHSVDYNTDWPRQDDFFYSDIYPSLHLENGLVLPNLTRLHWSRRDEGFPRICLFFGPKITSIHINFRVKPSWANVSVLHLLSLKCPKLEDVFIDMNDEVNEDEAKPLTFISHFIMGLSNRIQSLTVGIPDMSALLHIAQLPSLRQLGAHGLSVSLSTLTPNGGLFVSLRELTIRGSSMDSVSNFVKLCSDSTLESLWVDASLYSPPRTMQSLFTIIADDHRTSLTKLTVWNDECDMGGHVASADDLFTIATLRPTLLLSNLSEFRIMSMHEYNFDDWDISRMARAWRHIRVLEFSSEHRGTNAQTTLGALQILARHCPHLEELTMEFTSDVVPSIEGTPAPNHPLTALDVKSSVISSPTLLVARFISGIFPNLKYLATEYKSEFAQQWKEVKMAIPVLVQVRQEGARWAQSGT
ncbi:hypothetical protein FB45DRAFT_1052316 [Roridomyces roridus]|uniref:F-box protein n=1 Tax=Roridomyces roridus TaxID=1738132 RepID=A0AAD7CGA2_9AGAR|nr:hypothetical protein FB45DRAFT_1052316 [Roridomyces roridus]